MAYQKAGAIRQQGGAGMGLATKVPGEDSIREGIDAKGTGVRQMGVEIKQMTQESGARGSRVAISVAPNGARRIKDDHPAIPLTPAELARDAVACLEAGAAMIHLHVRDGRGGHLLDADAYRAAIHEVKAAVGDRLVIQITSEAVGVYAPETQMRVVREVRPESVSLALRELLPNAGAEQEFAEFLEDLRDGGVAVQFILYTPAEADRLADLQRRGLIPWESLSVLYVLGRYTVGQRSEPADLEPFLDPARPCFASWMLCAFGPTEAACVTAGAQRGGDVRVGFENNLWLPDGSVASNNAAIVRATAEALGDAGLALEDASGLRRKWGIG